jgi:integrase/recombinase XerC
LVLLLLHTGLRAAEAAALRWGDVDLDGAASVTVEGKGRVVRTIPLSSTVAGALIDWAAFSGARRVTLEPVITRVKHRVAGAASRSNRAGEWEQTPEPLSADAVHGIVTRRAARAGLKDVTPHALRRTFATKLRDLGVSIDTISRYLGHASIQTTVAYFNPDDSTATATIRELSYSAR